MRTIPRMKPYLGYGILLKSIWRLLLVQKRGDSVAKFEKAFKERFGCAYAHTVSHARFAFYFILKALELPKGSEILITPLHVSDFVNMIILLGLKPVFVDLKPRTYNIDEKDLLTKIGPNSRVLLVTHLCGLVTDMAPIVDICKKKSILLVEDCSQASGARYNGRLLGTFGLAGIFSLSFMKTLSTLDGGMIISNDSALIDKLRRLTEDLPLPPKPFMLKSLVKNIAFKLATDRIIFSLITYTTIRFMNCFMKDIFEKLQRGNPSPFLRTEFPGEMCFKYTDLQAEMGLVQLSRLDEYNQRRIANAKFLIDSLARHNSILPLTPKNSESIFWLFPLYILDSKTFRNFLFERGVDTGMFLLFVCSSLPCFNQWVMVTEIAEETKEHTVFIPIHSFLDEADMKKIASAINQYLKAQA